MPISSSAFVRSTGALLLVGLFALLAIVGTSLWLVERTQSYFDEVIQAREVRSAIVGVLVLAQDAETGQRGYLLTLDEAYLQPFEDAKARMELQIAKVRTLLGNVAGTAPVVDQIKVLMTGKFAELESTIDLAKAGRTAEALQIVRANSGKTLMDEARTVLDAMIEGADIRLQQKVEEQRASAMWLRWVTVAGAVVIVLVVGGSALTALSYTRDLGQARAEVEMLNEGLEARVSERTHDLSRANEEIQRFAYIVTHDLRAPLVNIMGFTSELETSIAAVRGYIERTEIDEQDQMARDARLAATEDLPEAIDFIRSSTRKMDALINAILKISREGGRKLKPEPVDLTTLLTAASDAVHHQMDEVGGQVTFDIAVKTVISDQLSLEQVFGNLLDNAIKYRSPDRPPRVEIATRTIGKRIEIEFADNGRGIAPQDHERVFELFRRSGAQDQKGEGIGLAHVRTVVRNLGGDIKLSSELGKGTTFRIDLPRDLRGFIGNTAT